MKYILAALAGVLAFADARMGRIFKSVSRSTEELVQKAKKRIGETDLNPQEYYYSATIDHFTNHGAGSPTY